MRSPQVEHGRYARAHLGRPRREANAESREPFGFGPYILDREGGNGMPPPSWLAGLAGHVTTVGTSKRLLEWLRASIRWVGAASARTLLLPRDTVLNHQMHSDDPLP